MQRGILALVMCGAVGSCSHVHAPTAGTRAFVEHEEPGVLVIALSSSAVDTDDTGHPSGLLDIQLQLAEKASRYGSVLVLAPSAQIQSDVGVYCESYGSLCERIHNGLVRVLVDAHRGVWIRDYGPFVNLSSDNKAVVVDAKYDPDSRRRVSYEYRRDEINRIREKRLEERLDDALFEAQVYGADRGGANLTALDVLLAETAKLYQDLNNSRSRAEDDDAPYYVAEAGLEENRFQLVKTDLYVEGGNLFRMEDGGCLTTTDTIAKNDGNRQRVESVLRNDFRCKNITFLEALPGEGVIKHIDMFLMPVSKKKVLLASFGPDSLLFADRWAGLSVELRGLVTQAAIAMAHNKERLQRLGYTVIDVPALFPRLGNDIYFPTMLNGIVVVGPNRDQHVIVPDYATSDEAEKTVKARAIDVIRQAFGGVDVDTIESTASAQMQGALHCLTSTLPRKASVFAVDDASARAVRASIETLTVHKPDEVLASATPSTSGPRERSRARSTSAALPQCLKDFVGDWRETDAGENAMVLSISADRIHVGGKDEDFSFSFSARCNELRPHEATLVVSEDGKSFDATLLLDADDTLVFEISDLRMTFERSGSDEDPSPRGLEARPRDPDSDN